MTVKNKCQKLIFPKKEKTLISKLIIAFKTLFIIFFTFYNRRPICEPLYCYNNMYLLVLVTHALSARKFLVPRAIKNILYFYLGLSRISWGMRTYWSSRKQFVLILSQASHHHCLSFIKYIYLFMRIYLRN